jgi:hypothetical protein
VSPDLPPLVLAAFDDPNPIPLRRSLHIVLAIIANDAGEVETTLHSLEHMTGMPAELIRRQLVEPMYPLPISATVSEEGIVRVAFNEPEETP